MIVTLTRGEMLYAARVGVERQVEAIVHGRRPRYPYADAAEPFGRHVVGALGELAVAKARGRYWSPVHDEPHGKPDLDRVEVRSSCHADACLRVYEADTAPFYALVIVEALPEVRLAGWAERSLVLASGYWRPQRSRWEIPQGALKPFSAESANREVA